MLSSYAYQIIGSLLDFFWAWMLQDLVFLLTNQRNRNCSTSVNWAKFWYLSLFGLSSLRCLVKVEYEPYLLLHLQGELKIHATKATSTSCTCWSVLAQAAWRCTHVTTKLKISGWRTPWVPSGDRRLLYALPQYFYAPVGSIGIAETTMNQPVPPCTHVWHLLAQRSPDWSLYQACEVFMAPIWPGFFKQLYTEGVQLHAK